MRDKKSISEEVIFQPTLDGRVDIGQLKSVWGRKNSTCKGHEARKMLARRTMLTMRQ